MQRIGVAQHERRLPERAGKVFPHREIDRRFPADGGIHRSKKRCRDLHETDAALVARRGKADHIADDAAAERDNNVAPGHAVFRKKTEDTLPAAERFGAFPGEEIILQHGKARIFQRIGHAPGIERVYRRIGVDDRLFRARNGGGNALAAFAEQPRADADVVFAGRPDMDGFHRPSISSLRRRPSSSRAVSDARSFSSTAAR